MLQWHIHKISLGGDGVNNVFGEFRLRLKKNEHLESGGVGGVNNMFGEFCLRVREERTCTGNLEG